LAFFTRDPRILLLRPSFHAAATGVYFLLTLLFGRPLLYEAATPLAAKGDPMRLAAYERTWERSARFRKLERVLTGAWGAGLLLEAALRTWIVFHFSVERAVVPAHAPGIAILLILGVVTRQAIPVLRDIVKAEYRYANPDLR
jgi:hypothetical protein